MNQDNIHFDVVRNVEDKDLNEDFDSIETWVECLKCNSKSHHSFSIFKNSEGRLDFKSYWGCEKCEFRLPITEEQSKFISAKRKEIETTTPEFKKKTVKNIQDKLRPRLKEKKLI